MSGRLFPELVSRLSGKKSLPVLKRFLRDKYLVHGKHILEVAVLCRRYPFASAAAAASEEYAVAQEDQFDIGAAAFTDDAAAQSNVMDAVQRIDHYPGVPEIAFVSVCVHQLIEFFLQIVDLIANRFIPAYKAYLHPGFRAVEHHRFSEQYRFFCKEVGMLIIAPDTRYTDQKAVSTLPPHSDARLLAAACQAVFIV